MKIDIKTPQEGVFSLPAKCRKPDEAGVLTQMMLAHPPARAICHYTAFQRHDPMRQARQDQSIGGGANRVQGLRIERWSEAIEGGLFAVLQLEDGDWLVLLPIAGRKSLAWLAPEGEDVTVKVGTLGTEEVEGELPVLAWCRSDDVYAACRRAWELALNHPLVDGVGRMREEKCYPEIFRYLGWCSWEQYKRDISSEVLADAARRINDSDLPIRFVLVDDGYFCHTEGEGPMQNQLLRFGPNPETFPEGWDPLLSEREEKGIRWFGLWQNFNGYWGRIASDNQLGEELNRHLMEVPAGGLLPRAGMPDATAWYEAMLAVAREPGFDFVKVDNQAKNLLNYEGTGNAVEAAVRCSQAFERAAAAQVDGVINCMAHGPVSTFNTCLSAVTRCSEDYRVNDAWRAKAHLHNSYQNMLWLGPTVWGDHDMFHSSDTFAGRMMAVSKAVSGGPVYLSDDPDDFDPGLVRPLCWEDGRLLRPLAPAEPLPRSVMVDPFEDGEPYVVATALPNGAAALVAYNLTEPTEPVSGRIMPEDYWNALSRSHRPDGTPRERPPAAEAMVLFDWYAGEAVLLEEGWDYELETFEDRFVLLCPVHKGWAVIGRADKYLSPAGVDVLFAGREEIILRSREAGTVTLWREGDLHKVEVPTGTRRIEVCEF
jgi:hypothetical protein